MGGMQMRIDRNPYLISDELLAGVYESAGYGAASDYLSRPGLVTRSFPPGVFGFFALVAAEDLVGFARVFSDNDLCSWIAEMCVRADQRADAVRGALLRSLIERLATPPSIWSVRGRNRSLSERRHHCESDIDRVSRAPGAPN